MYVLNPIVTLRYALEPRTVLSLRFTPPCLFVKRRSLLFPNRQQPVGQLDVGCESNAAVPEPGEPRCAVLLEQQQRRGELAAECGDSLRVLRLAGRSVPLGP